MSKGPGMVEAMKDANCWTRAPCVASSNGPIVRPNPSTSGATSRRLVASEELSVRSQLARDETPGPDPWRKSTGVPAPPPDSKKWVWNLPCSTDCSKISATPKVCPRRSALATPSCHPTAHAQTAWNHRLPDASTCAPGHHLLTNRLIQSGSTEQRCGIPLRWTPNLNCSAGGHHDGLRHTSTADPENVPTPRMR